MVAELYVFFSLFSSSCNVSMHFQALVWLCMCTGHGAFPFFLKSRTHLRKLCRDWICWTSVICEKFCKNVLPNLFNMFRLISKVHLVWRSSKKGNVFYSVLHKNCGLPGGTFTFTCICKYLHVKAETCIQVFKDWRFSPWRDYHICPRCPKDRNKLKPLSDMHFSTLKLTLTDHVGFMSVHVTKYNLCRNVQKVILNGRH